MKQLNRDTPEQVYDQGAFNRLSNVLDTRGRMQPIAREGEDNFTAERRFEEAQ